MTDVIHVVESAYRLEASTETEWLRDVAQIVRQNLPLGETAIAYAYEIRQNGWVDVRSVAELDTPAGFARDLLNMGPVPEDAQRAFGEVYRRSEVFQSQLSPARRAIPADFFRPYYERILSHGFRDLITVNAADATPSGCFICFPSATEGLDRSLRKLRKTWSQIAAHIAAGHRLHREVLNARPTVAASDTAVLTPSGRMEHATGAATQRSARDVLRSAVLAMDRARGSLRKRNPEEAVEIWRGLVAGRWSLVDRFESDGRRYVVAHRNDPQTPDPRALTPRERQVLGYANLGHSNKLIAYELGLASSTVGVLLSRARAKLGIHAA